MTDSNSEERGRARLSDEDVRQWAAEHHPWAVGAGSDRLLRTFRFEDFGGAMKFMAKVEPVAERLDHHPEWRNVQRTVWVELTTHDVGGITAADLALGAAMNEAAHELGAD